MRLLATAIITFPDMEVISMVEQDKEKLKTLLDYLIKHNGEHCEELRELAENAKTMAMDLAKEDIREAARLMSESTEYLKKALTELMKD